jgi:hypothetical protein
VRSLQGKCIPRSHHLRACAVASFFSLTLSNSCHFVGRTTPCDFTCIDIVGPANTLRKIRKIRCDGRLEGCSPCAQNRTPCTTTDRISGRAKTRGHAEVMEAENNYLKAQVAELQAQVKELGAEPRVASSYELPNTAMQWGSTVGSGSRKWSESSQRRTSTSPQPGYTPANGAETNEHRPLPQFKPGSIGDNYLGVSSAASLPSHIKGTCLSVFGTEIDVANFINTEADYEKSVMSYDHFLRIALNEDNVQAVPFPAYQDLRDYATWYLRSLNPYTMLLDKPTFMRLVRLSSNME